MITGTYELSIQSASGVELTQITAKANENWDGSYFEVIIQPFQGIGLQNIKTPLSGLNTKNQQESIKYLERIIKVTYLDPNNFPETVVVQFNNYTPVPVAKQPPQPSPVETPPPPRQTPAQLEEQVKQEEVQS